MRGYHLGLIGYGAIGRAVTAACLAKQVCDASMVAILVRDILHYSSDRDVLRAQQIVLTDQPNEFFSYTYDMVVEAAGQTAVKQYGARILGLGMDFMVTSIGAFTDEALYQLLIQTAKVSHQKMYLVGGALPGASWMQGAALDNVNEVSITQCKPVRSWQHTPAEHMINLDAISEPSCFFTGSARQAASLFQKSSNIAAMLALSTVGLDNTHVALVADPVKTLMETKIAFDGDAGKVRITWQSSPSEHNPSTSRDVPLNVIKAIRNIVSPVVLGV